MFVLNIAKSVLTFGVSAGAGVTVKFLVDAITPDTLVKPLTRIALKASTIVIGAAIGELASNYIEKQIDSVVDVAVALKEIAALKRELKANNVN